MIYIELTLEIEPISPFSDIIMSDLGDVGFESFVDTDTGLKAYIPKPDFDENAVKRVIDNVENCSVTYAVEEMPDENWNAVWESTHEPVLVEDFCWVYAPFHSINTEVKYNILIEPKMSFGTAHHSTTYMMLSFLRDEELEGRKVLDMGSGTGVLAILAKMKGAAETDAIDNDEWAYRNALENVEANGCTGINVLLGDAQLLNEKGFYDVVIANINRNILLRDMHAYIEHLNTGGILLLSGFYEHDIPSIRQEAEKNGMAFESFRERNEWVACKFVKK
jgi:ribosomal protein L11 methyltransferase